MKLEDVVRRRSVPTWEYRFLVATSGFGLFAFGRLLTHFNDYAFVVFSAGLCLGYEALRYRYEEKERARVLAAFKEDTQSAPPKSRNGVHKQ